MTNIQEKLDSLQPFINGIRYIQGTQIVDAMFKEGWTVPNSEIIRKELVDKDQNYYMFFSENTSITFDDLLDYVENIIKINIERENKHALLKAKVKELQVVFKENSLSKLEKLKFTFSEDDLTPSLMEMDMDLDEDFNEEPTEMKPVEYVEEEIPTQQMVETKSRVVNANGQNIELPPKKVVLENYDLPPEAKVGSCSCGENEACSKCIDTKY